MANEFAINDKSPCVVLCPSRDTVGYQTTLLADLAGLTDGTLLNMDAGTDWVSDTGAGGTRALDLDGTNDAVGLPTIPFAAGWSLSIWAKWASFSGLTFAFCARDANRVYIGQNGGVVYVRIGSDSGDLGSSTSLTLNQWHHLVVSIASDGLSYSGWCDGTSLGSSRSTTLTTPTFCGIGAFFANVNTPSSNYASARVDDLRIWNRNPLDDADATALWASGAGRGKVESVGSTVIVIED
jgi:hypothetical protein